MENAPPSPGHAGTNGQSSPNSANSASESQNRKRSGSGNSILSRFPFMRTSESKSNLKDPRHSDIAGDALSRPPPPRALATIAAGQQHAQLQKTRKRKGSLRKVALLGRGAQRERREMKPLTVDPTPQPTQLPLPKAATFAAHDGIHHSESTQSPMDSPELGLGISEETPRPSMEGYARRVDVVPTHKPQSHLRPPTPPPAGESSDSHTTSGTVSYVSTTEDEEDNPSLKLQKPSPMRPGMVSASSGSDSYFSKTAHNLSLQRRRSVKQHAKSPLSLGLSASPLPPPEAEYDYSETEWWGWVILVVTWIVFAMGMGSCLGVWSWAWDVGTTPYAPPELEDDPTLPIVGYYPSLMILTCIMAWVWVITAWVGMKYFRHAKISGD